MADHWSALGARLDRDPGLAAGAQAARELLDELRRLEAARELEVGRAALGAGRLARARPLLPDVVLERNQALRFAVLDAEHLLVLVAYVRGLCVAEGDPELAAATERWEQALRGPADAVREAAIALGTDADAAVEPLSPGHKVNYLLGWLGEAVDRRARG